MKKHNLSVVLATFNEEKNLRACLASVKDFADEIIIVDGTSSDSTVEIAKEFGAKIKVTSNKPNFHINKQMAIDMATCDWILQMDADEHVSDELKKEVKEVIKKNSKEFNGYWIPRKNYFLGRFLMKGGQYPDYTIRLYRNGKGKLPQKDVHEQAVVAGKVDHLKEAILHYPYADFNSYLFKWNRYNDFASVQIKEELARKNFLLKVLKGFDYLFFKPIYWFLLSYIRHKGIMDGWQGFTFSLFSSLRFPASYIKYVGAFRFTLALIFILSVFLRFYNFPSRWGVAGDDSRDALIALDAIRRGEIPLTGSFSSAGPFVFGGIFYWFLILSYMLLPFLINAPWLFTAIIGVITVFLLVYVGYEIGGKLFAVIIGLLAATSPQLVARSLILGQHTFISTFSILAILFILLLWREKKARYAFFAGLSIGLGLNFHYQAINLIIFVPAVFLIPGLTWKSKIQSFLAMSLGLVIPMVELLYWDAQQGFANMRNLADYFLIAQYRLYVPNSWRIFILNSLPSYWSFVEGKYRETALLLSVVTGVVFFSLLIFRKVSGKIVYFIGVFYFLLFLNRYYKGEHSESYLLYFIPFILIISAWFINLTLVSKKNIIKLLGLAIFAMILIGNFVGDSETMRYISPYNKFKNTAERLYQMFPGKKFDIYDFGYLQYSQSMPLSLIFAFDNMEDLSGGKKIGISCFGNPCPPKNPPTLISDPLLIVDLDGVDSLKKKGWVRVNRENVYDDLPGWLVSNKLKSTFSFSDYFSDKLNLK